MSVYYEYLMDLWPKRDISEFRKQVLRCLDVLSPEEAKRVLELCRASEDWNQSYVRSLEPEALESMLKLHLRCLGPEELTRFLARVRNSLGLPEGPEDKSDNN
jgi:hypothetical protein